MTIPIDVAAALLASVTVEGPSAANREAF